jgi:hypothetical protein
MISHALGPRPGELLVIILCFTFFGEQNGDCMLSIMCACLKTSPRSQQPFGSRSSSSSSNNNNDSNDNDNNNNSNNNNK